MWLLRGGRGVISYRARFEELLENIHVMVRVVCLSTDLGSIGVISLRLVSWRNAALFCYIFIF